MSKAKELVMRFDPNTIEHLGVKMYSQIPTAIAELIANAYDADATRVTVTLKDGDSKSIIVEDNGVGMTFDEVNSDFLVIGRNRRECGQNKSPSGNRVATGKKGLGKLALFGLGNTIEVITTKEKQKVHFKMEWDKLKQTTGSDYAPEIIAIEDTTDESGTSIILSDLKRKSPLDETDLAISLSKLFNLYDSNFKVMVINEDRKIEVTKDLRYSSIESQFKFPIQSFVGSVSEEYPHKKEINGFVFTTEKPLKPGLRGITLFANGRLVNAPEFFGRTESSHFYSYATGWIEVDFIDNWEQDVISTNRQSLDWDLEETELLREILQTIVRAIEVEWREKRKKQIEDDVSEDTDINITDWYDHLPSELLPKVKKVVSTVIKKELTKEDQGEVIKELNSLVPSYPYFHWRNLHEVIKNSSKDYYKNQDYYGAFLEAVKKYANASRSKSGIGHGPTDDDLMAKAFHPNSGSLTVTTGFARSNGDPFSPDTLENIQQGQFHFSKGTIAGGRNPVAHEEIQDLRVSGLFSEKDCLDLLSLLSHLHGRLDNAQLKSP